jgi:branched-chain amino acid transport system substrate-binding protein
MEMLTRAIAKANSTDPRAVALALEGMTYQSEVGTVTMRKEDHQLLLPLYISTLEKKGTPGVVHDINGSGYGFRTDLRMDARELVPATTCKMVRPAK